MNTIEKIRNHMLQIDQLLNDLTEEQRQSKLRKRLIQNFQNTKDKVFNAIEKSLGLTTKECTNLIGVSALPILNQLEADGLVSSTKVKGRTKPSTIWKINNRSLAEIVTEEVISK